MTALVRAQYTAADAIAAGAWIWEAPDGLVWVLIDVQSALPGVVQARAELWAGDSSGVARFGRSEVMAAAAEFGAYAFEDLTGDSVPDLLGYVADSAGVSYPVFIAGARGAMTDALEDAARGWVFTSDDTALPQPLRGAAGVCGLRLWSDQPADSGSAGWRYLLLDRRGTLSAPTASAPLCP